MTHIFTPVFISVLATYIYMNTLSDTHFCSVFQYNQFKQSITSKDVDSDVIFWWFANISRRCKWNALHILKIKHTMLMQSAFCWSLHIYSIIILIDVCYDRHDVLCLKNHKNIVIQGCNHLVIYNKCLLCKYIWFIYNPNKYQTSLHLIDPCNCYWLKLDKTV